tara:strand:+ start:8067 stop:8243 length:177 start_codon:yes stop_codon:yes gene_type:complete
MDNFLICVFAAIGFIVGFAVGSAYTDHVKNVEAFANGVAYYDCAPETGKCVFKYKEVE